MERNCLVFNFADIEVREREFLLIKAGERLPVEPTAFRVLLFLLRNAGRIVSKEEIVASVWNDVAVSDNSLTRAIAQLRRVLDDDPREPRYILTVPTLGYRFLCDVKVAEESVGAIRSPRSDQGIHSLAVLPFANGTGPAEAEYLSEGISESIINLLSQFPDLRVVPRTSAFRCKGLEADLKRVGRDLNVDVVLTGAVVQRGDRLIVQTELTDIGNEAQIWGGQYNRRLEDIFELQEELARRISESLRPRLTPDEDKLLSRRPTENREAYLLYLKAIYHANKWSPDGIQKGISYSKQAIEADPLFAEAYAGLAYIYSLLGIFGGLPPLQAFPLAKSAALRALEIDDTVANAHACLTYLLLAYDWDWAGAERESRRAMELGPNLPGGHYVRSQWCLLNGRSDEAIAEARKTLELDPLSLPNYQLLAGTYYMLGEFDSAIEQLHQALQLDSSFIPARQMLALSYAFKGSHHEALAEAAIAASPSAGKSQTDIHARGIWGIIHAVAGKEAEARRALAMLIEYQQPSDYLSPIYCAAIHALLDEKDEAFQWIEKARPGRGLWELRIRPEFRALHIDPRFPDLLRQIGFPLTKGDGS
jgi:TolB-like protein